MTDTPTTTTLTAPPWARPAFEAARDAIKDMQWGADTRGQAWGNLNRLAAGLPQDILDAQRALEDLGQYCAVRRRGAVIEAIRTVRALTGQCPGRAVTDDVDRVVALIAVERRPSAVSATVGAVLRTGTYHPAELRAAVGDVIDAVGPDAAAPLVEAMGLVPEWGPCTSPAHPGPGAPQWGWGWAPGGMLHSDGTRLPAGTEVDAALDLGATLGPIGAALIAAHHMGVQPVVMPHARVGARVGIIDGYGHLSEGETLGLLETLAHYARARAEHGPDDGGDEPDEEPDADAAGEAWKHVGVVA